MQLPSFNPSTSGLINWQAEIAGYRFSETNHRQGVRLPKHSHDLASINFVLDGNYHETCTCTDGSFEKHQLLYKPPGETHSNCFGNDQAVCLLIEFTSDRFTYLADQLPWLMRNVQYVNPMIGVYVQKLIAELKSLRQASRLVIESHMLDLLLTIDDAQRISKRTLPAWLENVAEYLIHHKHLNLSLDEIATQFGVHSAHLARQFKQHYGATVGSYVRKLKVDEAARLLSSTDLTIAEIAARCGFADQSHLGRWFKKIQGMTPGQFRLSAN